MWGMALDMMGNVQYNKVTSLQALPSSIFVQFIEEVVVRFRHDEIGWITVKSSRCPSLHVILTFSVRNRHQKWQ